MRKKIGIPAWDTTPKEVFGVTMPYLMWIRKFGDVVMLMPGEFRDDLDLLVLPGGLDVDSRRYNETPGFANSRPNQFLEHFDINTLPKYIGAKTPIFGICRGIQTLAVHFGGSLKQHLWQHPTSDSVYDLDAHPVFRVNEHGIAVGKKAFEVGSWHHQSVKDPGNGMEVLLVAHDGEIEAMRHRELAIAAVQYHPERMHDAYSTNMVKTLLKLI